jgi:hypothetical protein
VEQIEHRLFSHITMNWRGRPLTSHDVVVNTIAATRTRAGLHVEAELDPSAYPLGVSVSAERMSNLPIAAHAAHGTWNYTIRPSGHHTQSAAHNGDRDRSRPQALLELADPRLTGMSRGMLDQLAADLGLAQAARAEQRFFEQRGGPRRQAKGSHGRPLLTDAAKVVITVVYQRQVCSQLVLSEMLEISEYPIGKAITETGRLLAERKHAIVPTVLRFTTANELRDFLATGTPPARPDRLATLSDPALTGMSRQDLTELTERLSFRQAAEAERRNHQRRGRDRLPGTRGGIFTEKITDPERVLAVILGLRKVCTWSVVAELFQVSRRTIGNASAWVRPLLEQDGCTITRSATRYPTATALLTAISGQAESADASESAS